MGRLEELECEAWDPLDSRAQCALWSWRSRLRWPRPLPRSTILEDRSNTRLENLVFLLRMREMVRRFRMFTSEPSSILVRGDFRDFERRVIATNRQSGKTEMMRRRVANYVAQSQAEPLRVLPRLPLHDELHFELGPGGLGRDAIDLVLRGDVVGEAIRMTNLDKNGKWR